MTKAPKKPADDQRTEAETAKVRDVTLKRMLATKPKPHNRDQSTAKSKKR